MAYMHDHRDELLYGGINVICKQCNRKVLEKCISCGCFKPEKKLPPSALCGGCGQIKAKCPPEDGSDEDEAEEEEDYIKQSGGVLRRKCSCCNRARDSCTKCGRAYISDSEDDCESVKDSDDEAEDNEEEEVSESEEEQTPAKKQKKAETKGGKK